MAVATAGADLEVGLAAVAMVGWAVAAVAAGVAVVDSAVVQETAAAGWAAPDSEAAAGLAHPVATAAGLETGPASQQTAGRRAGTVAAVPTSQRPSLFSSSPSRRLACVQVAQALLRAVL